MILSGTATRRHAGPGGDQGGGRPHLCPGRLGPLRLDAAQRDRGRLRGFRACRPGAIARELARIARHPYVAGRSGRSPLFDRGRRGPRRRLGARPAGVARGCTPGARRSRSDADRQRRPDGYQEILLLLRNHCGVDFSLYKSTTIHRRITRRMVLNQQDTLEDYAGFLRGNAKELDALYSDALISVTSFFRNADAFDVAQAQGLPQAAPAARRRSRCGSGCSAAPPGRRPIPSRWRSPRRRRKSPPAQAPGVRHRSQRGQSREGPPRALRQDASRRISRRSGCSVSSSRRTAATG